MRNINNEIYNMYEIEVNKANKLSKENQNLKLEIYCLKTELKKTNNNIDRKVENAIKPYIDENIKLKSELDKALNEIARLKKEVEKKNCNSEDKDYIIDKLNNQVNKDSTNSSIPTSKEIKPRNEKKTGANTYNHREKSGNKTGGKFGHKGKTLSKEIIERKIKQNNLEVRTIKHYINGDENKEEIKKYRVGVEMKVYVEEHIFISTPNSQEKLPKEFYSDVTYKDSNT